MSGFHEYKKAHSVDGLRYPTNDSSIFPNSALPTSDTGLQMADHDFHAAAGFPHYDSYGNMLGQESESSEDYLAEFINPSVLTLDPGHAPNTALRMSPGAFHLPEGSQSSRSSISSKRQKSNDGSARSSFSVEEQTGRNETGGQNDFSNIRLGGGPQAAAATTYGIRPEALPEIDTMAQRAGDLQMSSPDHSPLELSHSNLWTGHGLAGVPIPHDTPALNTNTNFTMDQYPEFTAGSLDSSPVNFQRSDPWMPSHGMPVVHGRPYTLPLRQNQPQANRDGSSFQYQGYTPAQTSPATSPMRYYQTLQNLTPNSKDIWVLASRRGTRVETAIDIRIVLLEPPPWLEKVRISKDHLTKPKHLVKDEPLSRDTLKLRATVFRHGPGPQTQSQDEAMLECAATHKHPVSSHETKKESSSPTREDTPTCAGVLVIVCKNCSGREGKRLTRSKPITEENKEWLNEAKRRTVVFNDSPTKDLKHPNDTAPAPQILAQAPQPQNVSGESEDKRKKKVPKLPMPPIEPNTRAVDLSMRITCYCRHQSPCSGFRVVFTFEDHLGKIFKQVLTDSIVITDDHKDKEKKESAPPTPSHEHQGQFAFPNMQNAPTYTSGIQQSYSTPDLASMAHGHGHGYVQPQYMGQQPQMYFNTPAQAGPSHVTGGAMTPQNRSRQASPTGAHGPQLKKRKNSGSGMGSEFLQMTRMDHNQPTNHGRQSAAVARRTHPSSYNRRSHPMGMTGYTTNPPSPSGNRPYPNFHRSQSMENVPKGPHSTQFSAHQSLQSSPPENQFNFMGFQPNLAQVNHSLYNTQAVNLSTHQSNNLQSVSQSTAQLQQMPTQENTNVASSSSPKLECVDMQPDKGPASGGTRCIALGNGFNQVVQVFFGHQLALWFQIHSDTSLACLAPPCDGPRLVHVRFVGHNGLDLAHPTPYFQYLDDESSNGGHGNSMPVKTEDPSSQFDQYRNNGNGQMLDPRNQQQRFTGQPYPPQPGQGYDPRGGGSYNRSRKLQDFCETPPSYECVIAEDDQRGLNSKKDLEIKSLLRATGDALMDYKAGQAFDTPTTEASTLKPANPRATQHVTIGRSVITEEQREKIRAERRENVKGLRKDLKLWFIWLPILFLILTLMTTSNAPWLWGGLCALFGYIGDAVLSPLACVAQEFMGLIQARIGHTGRVVELG